MSEHYHDAADLRLFKDMSKLAPKEFEAGSVSTTSSYVRTGRCPGSIAS